MKTRLTFRLITILSLAMLCATLTVRGEEQPANPPVPPPTNAGTTTPKPEVQLVRPDIIEELQLTPKQQSQYEKLLKDYRATHEKLKPDIKPMRQALAAKHEAAQSKDEARIGAAETQYQQVYKKYKEQTQPVMEARNKAFADFKALLTDEQRTAYEDLSKTKPPPMKMPLPQQTRPGLPQERTP